MYRDEEKSVSMIELKRRTS